MAEGYVLSLLPGSQDIHIVMTFLKISEERETDFCSARLDVPRKEEILNLSHMHSFLTMACLYSQILQPLLLRNLKV